jgi:hypothetical protein
MANTAAGIGLILIGLVCGVLALLMAFGTLLDFSRATAFYAGLFGLASVAALWTGARLRRRP